MPGQISRAFELIQAGNWGNLADLVTTLLQAGAVQLLYFCIAWLLASFLFLLVFARPDTRPAGWMSRLYTLGILGLATVGYAALTGQAILAVLFVLLTWYICDRLRRHLPDWNVLGVQHFAAIAVGSVLLLLLIAVDLRWLVGKPVALAVAGAFFVADIFITAISVGYAFEPLDVLCRVRWRRLFPPIAFRTGYYPMVSIHVPAHSEPVEMVKETLRSLVQLDYPNYEIIMIDDNTAEPELWQPVMEYCREHGIRTYHLQAYPGFKSGALNFALAQMSPEAQIIAVVDSDYQVERDYLKRTVGYFENPEIAFVQTPQAFREVDSPYLERIDLSQRYFFDVGMRTRNERNAIIFCGTMGLIRKTALRRAGGWGEWCVTEDAELSLRLLGKGYSGAYVHQVFGRGLLPLTFDDLRKQRFRWALGGVQILKAYLLPLLGLGFGERRLRLTMSQRLAYLLGGFGWFTELLVLLFSLALLVIIGASVAGLPLPVRMLSGPLLLPPLLFIYTGVLRTVWALRQSARCSWLTALGAFWTWLSLSLTVARACISGLIVKKAAFLRTPKTGDSPSPFDALSGLRIELILGLALVAAVPALLLGQPSLQSALISGLLAWHACVYWSAPWNAWGSYSGPTWYWRLVARTGILFAVVPLGLWLGLLWVLPGVSHPA